MSVSKIENKKYDTGISKWIHGQKIGGYKEWHRFLGPCPDCGLQTFDYGGGVSCHKDFQAENNLLRAAFDNADRMIKGQQELILRLNEVLKEADAVIEEYYNHDDGSPLFRYKGLHDTQKKIRGVLE